MEGYASVTGKSGNNSIPVVSRPDTFLHMCISTRIAGGYPLSSLRTSWDCGIEGFEGFIAIYDDTKGLVSTILEDGWKGIASSGISTSESSTSRHHGVTI